MFYSCDSFVLILINSGVNYFGMMCVMIDPLDLLRLTASDGSYLFVDDSNKNAIDYLWEIVIIIPKKS